MAQETHGHVDVLVGLAPRELESLLRASRTLTLGGGDHVFAEGDAGTELFVVRSGRVKITKRISLEVSRILTIVGKGGVFGELAIVDSAPRSATAEALETTELLVFGRETFERLAAEEPALGMKMTGRLAAVLAERLRITNELLRDTVAWGLEVSGAAAMNLQHVIKSYADVQMTLSTGKEVAGRLLKVERSPAGVELTVKDRDERLHLVPYHAIVCMTFPGELLAARTTGEV